MSHRLIRIAVFSSLLASGLANAEPQEPPPAEDAEPPADDGGDAGDTTEPAPERARADDSGATEAATAAAGGHRGITHGKGVYNLDVAIEIGLDDGAAFDPVTGSWRVLPASPIDGRTYAATVWTGTEMIVWGGSRAGQPVDDGAAFDPATDRWRKLPSAPIGPAMMSAATWTGSEMIIIGGLNGDGSSAAYDPESDSWRRLPDAPGSVTPPYLGPWVRRVHHDAGRRQLRRSG
jgi:hypothetical protein